jgi:hypothetical protein
VEWDSESGSGSGVNIESPGYPTEDAALVAEAEEIADGFRNLLKISNVSSGKKTSHRAGLAAVEAFIEKRKPAAEPEASAPPKPSGHRQTWGQWRATLQGVGGPDLGITVPDKIVLDEREQFFLERFRAGRRPAEARDAWKARQPAGGAAAAKPLPSVEALDHPQTPIDLPPAEIQPEPGHYYDADRFGVTPEQLAASLDAVAIHPPGNPNDGNPAPDPARIGRPLKIAGRFWAAVGASVEHHRVTYQLAPVVPEGETIVLYDNFDDLRTDHDDNDGRGSRDKAPEEYDLDGLGVVDPSNMRWVVARNEIYLRVPRDPETEARKLDPARAAKAGFDQARDAGKPFGEALQAGVDEIFKAPAATDDPAVDGRGVYVAGVREVWVTGTAKGDGAKVVIRVARGADGMYRTGHLLEFPGAQAWQADSDEPVKAAGQAAESEAYAIRARANILINRIKAAPTPGGKGGAWTAEQRRVYAAAIKALENFIAHNPAARLPGQAKAKAG